MWPIGIVYMAIRIRRALSSTDMLPEMISVACVAHVSELAMIYSAITEEGAHGLSVPFKRLNMCMVIDEDAM